MSMEGMLFCLISLARLFEITEQVKKLDLMIMEVMQVFCSIF